MSSLVESAKFKLGLSTYEHKELEGSEVGTKFEKDALEARAEFVHAPIANFEGVVGLQVQFSDFSSLGEEAFLPEVETFSPAFVFI